MSGGGVRGYTFKSFGKLSNGWTDWHKFGTRLWIHLGMDIGSSNSPHDTPGRHCGWFYGINNNSKDRQIVVKRLDGLGINFAHNDADESGNGQRLNKLAT